MRERHHQLQKNNNNGEKKSIKLTFNKIQQNPNQTFTYNGTQIKMSCACGPLSLVSIISSKGKSSQLTNYLSNGGYNTNNITGSGSKVAGLMEEEQDSKAQMVAIT